MKAIHTIYLVLAVAGLPLPGLAAEPSSDIGALDDSSAKRKSY